MFSILVSAAAALSATTPLHQVDFDHGSRSYQARYLTASMVSMQQVEPRFGTRAAASVCRWQAGLEVQRSVSTAGQALGVAAKPIHRFAPLSGSHAGSCDAVRGLIEAEVERYSQARSADAMAAAQQDRAVLIRELDGVHALSAKGG